MPGNGRHFQENSLKHMTTRKRLRPSPEHASPLQQDRFERA